MIPIRRRVLALTTLLMISTLPLWAHPHVFIDSTLEFEMKAEECVGIWVEWTFDVVFSADIIGQFDVDRDGRFNSTENEKVRAQAFSNLRKYGYFTFLRMGDNRSYPEVVDGFQAKQSDGRVTYRFHLPLEGKGLHGDFSVATFDSTFYCASRYAQEPASITWVGQKASRQPIISIVSNKEYPVFYNPAGGAGDTRVYTKMEKGLQTAYPEEIRVSFE